LEQEEYPCRASVLQPEVTELQAKFFQEADEVRGNILKLPADMESQNLMKFTNSCTDIAVKKLSCG
jgi:hypothetical protein